MNTDELAFELVKNVEGLSLDQAFQVLLILEEEGLLDDQALSYWLLEE